MIFYSDVAKNLAEGTYVYLTGMVVYKGLQPSIKNYVTGVNNGNYKWSGSNILQAYKDVELAVNKTDSIYKIKKTSADNTLYGNYIGSTGTASWAVLFDRSMFLGTNKLLEFTSNQLNFLRNITENDLFMIIPVTASSGDGVLRFDTISFDGTTNKAIKEFTFNFS
jgi:hypothetical protein